MTPRKSGGQRTNAARQARWRADKLALGLKRITLWVRPEAEPMLRDIEDQHRAEAERRIAMGEAAQDPAQDPAEGESRQSL
jgi:hypothetical protein